MSFHPKLGKTHATLSQTQHLASIGARRNSASRFYWRSIGIGTGY
ncbi:hypothetical protein [Leptospira noguchii]|nr:hypothetical protein [Leptospira noguchii]